MKILEKLINNTRHFYSKYNVLTTEESITEKSLLSFFPNNFKKLIKKVFSKIFPLYIGQQFMEKENNLIKIIKKILNEIQQDKFNWDPALEDVHMNIESRLVKIAGAAAKKIHTGRSRNDQVATDLRLFLMDKIDDLSKLLTVLQQSILQKAEGNSRNYNAWFYSFKKCTSNFFRTLFNVLCQKFLIENKKRFSNNLESLDENPLGVAALSGTSFNIDRNYTTKKLGFKKPTNNSIDTVSDRDFVIDFLYSVSVCSMHISRIAEELIIWNSDGFNLINLSDKVVTGSSIMTPKKKS